MEILTNLYIKLWLSKTYSKTAFEDVIHKSIGMHFQKLRISPYNLKELNEEIEEEVRNTKPEELEYLDFGSQYSDLGFLIDYNVDFKNNVLLVQVIDHRGRVYDKT